MDFMDTLDSKIIEEASVVIFATGGSLILTGIAEYMYVTNKLIPTTQDAYVSVVWGVVFLVCCKLLNRYLKKRNANNMTDCQSED